MEKRERYLIMQELLKRISLAKDLDEQEEVFALVTFYEWFIETF